MSLEDAWDALHAVLPAGWVVGRPSYRHERRVWGLHAHDPHERHKVGRRTRELVAEAPSEVGVVRGMAALPAR